MSEHVSTERMHEALDGALTTAEREELRAHLDACAACRNEYARLCEVVRAIHALPRAGRPPESAWGEILAAVEGVPQEEGTDEAVVLELPTARRAAVPALAPDMPPGVPAATAGDPPVTRRSVGRREIRLSITQLAAAAAVVALMSAGVMRLAMQDQAGTAPQAAASESTRGPRGAAARAVSLEDTRYAEMIDQLEQVLREGRAVLAPETLVTIDEALGTVDAAIAEIETALAEDPNSDLLLRLLATHQNTKLGVLRRAAGAVQAQI